MFMPLLLDMAVDVFNDLSRGFSLLVFFFAEAHRQVAVSYRDESVDQSFVVVAVQCRYYR